MIVALSESKILYLRYIDTILYIIILIAMQYVYVFNNIFDGDSRGSFFIHYLLYISSLPNMCWSIDDGGVPVRGVWFTTFTPKNQNTWEWYFNESWIVWVLYLKLSDITYYRYSSRYLINFFCQLNLF